MGSWYMTYWWEHHLVLALGWINGKYERSWSVVDKMALIWGAVERSETRVLEKLVVIMRLPLAVHLMAASCGEI